MRRKSRARRVLRDLAQRAREFDARRAGPDHHKCQPGLPFIGVDLALGKFKRRKNPPANLQRIADAFQAWRILRPVVVAEVRMPGAGGDNQIIVRKLAVVRRHHLAIQVDRRGLDQQYFDVLLMSEDAANRRSNIAGIEARCGHLVQQRLKQVMVPAIEQRDLDGLAGQLLGSVQPTKATSNDHNPRQ